MPRIRLLKGVAHDIAHSFTSLMNYRNGYYMDYVVAISQRDNLDRLNIDFFQETIEPDNYGCDETSNVIKYYKKWFIRRIWDLGFSSDDFQSLTLSLKLGNIKDHLSSEGKEIELSTTVSIQMTNGKDISYELNNTWLFFDDPRHYQEVIENMEEDKYKHIHVSPELDLVKYFMDEIFGCSSY